MKYYCEIVPFELAKKLKEAGYPQTRAHAYTEGGELLGMVKLAFKDANGAFPAPIYAEVLDWLIGKGLSVEMAKVKSLYSIHWVSRIEGIPQWERRRKTKLSFHEAANAAIENACEILKENG